LVIAALALLLAPSCEDDQSGVAGGGGSAGGGASSSSSSSSSGASSSGAGGNCHGEQQAWDAIEKTHIQCATPADCCVVLNGCTAQAQVVSKADYDTAAQVWPYCDADCVLCTLPIVDVTCRQGECVGTELQPDVDSGVVEGESHCGQNDPNATFDMPAMQFACTP